jgi:hypothetical protein
MILEQNWRFFETGRLFIAEVCRELFFAHLGVIDGESVSSSVVRSGAILVIGCRWMAALGKMTSSFMKTSVGQCWPRLIQR